MTVENNDCWIWIIVKIGSVLKLLEVLFGSSFSIILIHSKTSINLALHSYYSVKLDEKIVKSIKKKYSFDGRYCTREK